MFFLIATQNIFSTHYRGFCRERRIPGLFSGILFSFKRDFSLKYKVESQFLELRFVKSEMASGFQNLLHIEKMPNPCG